MYETDTDKVAARQKADTEREEKSITRSAVFHRLVDVNAHETVHMWDKETGDL